jgi:hypothetical protein
VLCVTVEQLHGVLFPDMRGLALFLLVLPLAACGGTSGSKSAAGTSLTATVRSSGASGDAKTVTIECPGDPECKELEALDPKVFEPVPSGVACTQIYGGPETAHVEGTLDGRPVNADFKRTDGCETARWAKVQFLFVRAG